ncbi:MAG TPA: uridine kinase [Anaerolineales bacterium]
MALAAVRGVYNPRMPPPAPSLIIGIAGGTASGKTTVANVILERVGADQIAFLPHDAYYRDLHDLPAALREQVNFDHPDSLETDLLIRHLQDLKRGQAVEVPIYDFTVHARTDRTRRLEPRPVILVEGILVFAEPALRQLFDVKIFVDTPDDIRFIRRLERDLIERGRSLESVIHQYQTTVRPMHLEFVEPSKRYADVIIPEGGMNSVALDMVVARIESLLASRPPEALAPGRGGEPRRR